MIAKRLDGKDFAGVKTFHLNIFVIFILLTSSLSAAKFEVESASINKGDMPVIENKLDSLYSVFKKHHKKEDQIKVMHLILEYKFINNINSAEDFKVLEKLLKGIKYGQLHARSDYLMGNIEKINGQGNKAIMHYLKALEYYTEKKDRNEMARMNLAIGENLRAFAEQEKALNYLRTAENLSQNEKINAEIYDRFAAVYFEMMYSHSPVYADSCKYYALKTEKYALKNNDNPLLLSTLNIMGAMERWKKNLVKAKDYLYRALNVAERSGRIADLSLIHSNIARLYEDEGNITECMIHAKKAYDLAVKSRIKIYIVMSSQILYQNYKKKNNYKETLKYYEIYIDYRDQLYTEDKNRQIALVMANTELDNKKKENSLLVKQKNLQETVIKKQKLNQIYLISVIGLITLFSCIIFYYIQKLKKANIRLKEEHAKVLNLERIRSAYAMAVTANHELNQPLMVLKGRLELLQMSMDESNEAQMKQMQKIEKVFDEVMDVLEKYRKSDRNIHFELYAGDEEMVVFDEEE